MSKKVERKYDLLLIFISAIILVQPFLDIYKTIVEHYFEICGISIIEIVNLVIIFSLCLITIIKNFEYFKKNPKKTILFLLLIIIYIAYIVIHVLHIKTFDTSLYLNSKINVFKEVYYIFRALLEPLILMLCLYFNSYKKEHIFKIISLLTFMICGLIVVANIFKFAFVAYSVENKPILDNIFAWFTFSDSYVKPLTSKGLFFSANELSNLLAFLFPINIYLLIKNKKFYNFMIVFLEALAMIMLGTKTATYSQLAILFGSLFLTIIMTIIERDSFKDYFNKYWRLYLVTLLMIPLTFYSPLFLEKRNTGSFPTEEIRIPKDIEIEVKDKNNEEKRIAINFSEFDCNEIDDENKELLSEYIKNNNYDYYVNNYYIEKYDVDNDLYFWCRTYKDDSINRKDSREMKTVIFSRIQERNNNKLDKYFGMGYTLNMLNIETDYYEIYFQFGIIGLLLFVGPYVLLFALSIIYFIKRIKVNFTYENIFLLLSMFCGLVSPHFSGHMHSNVFVTFPYALIVISTYKILKGDIK